MRKLLFAAAMLLALVAVSCQKPDDGPASGNGLPPGVESVTTADGADNVSTSLGVIDIVYDVPIILVNEGGITLSDTDINVSVANRRLRVEFGELNPGTSYVLAMAAGTVVSKSSGTPAEAFMLSFKTAGSPVDPEPPYTPGEPGDYSESLTTPDPIPNASRLYSYLLSIYGKSTLSGAMAKVNWNTDEAEWVGKWTGRYPAMAFFDYIHLASSPADWIDYSDITPVKNWFDAGGIAGACWHWNVPKAEGSSELTFGVDGKFSAANAVKDGTWENKVVKADLDKVAGYLLLLQEQGIPVVWRPLHEAAGNTYTQYHSGAWFWWGADGAEAYVALWRYMFDYFKGKGLRNLIWVWTTQTSSETDADYAYYPGDEYVDIVGRDIYNESSAEAIASQFTAIARMTTRKMVALSENGGVADMAAQWNAGAKWLFFMPWYDYDNNGSESFAHSYATISWWKSSFASDAVIDRDDLPDDLYE